MIEEILPAEVAAAEAFGEPQDAALYPEEAAWVARAVAKRRREFAGVRACARSALGSLGVPPVPLLPGAGGAPGWPPGIAGSMTRCAGYRAAAVARAADIASLGIDAEPGREVRDDVLSYITSPREHAALRSVGAAIPQASLGRMVFSAKESMYKAWFPLTRQWIGFTAVVITVQAGEGTFLARLQTP